MKDNGKMIRPMGSVSIIMLMAPLMRDNGKKTNKMGME